MQSKLFLILFMVSAAILVLGAIQNIAIAYPQQKQGYSHHDKMIIQPGLYAFGTIASLQNDENDNPAWIVSGLWKGNYSSLQAKAYLSTANASLPNATFYSKFNMVMINGSALHDHEIYDFKLTDLTTPNNSTVVYNGTATVTMRQGPVPNVPVSIKSMENNVISMWADPTKINNHFGSTPIFGIIQKVLIVEK